MSAPGSSTMVSRPGPGAQQQQRGEAEQQRPARSRPTTSGTPAGSGAAAPSSGCSCSSGCGAVCCASLGRAGPLTVLGSARRPPGAQTGRRATSAPRASRRAGAVAAPWTAMLHTGPAPRGLRPDADLRAPARDRAAYRRWHASVAGGAAPCCGLAADPAWPGTCRGRPARPAPARRRPDRSATATPTDPPTTTRTPPAVDRLGQRGLERLGRGGGLRRGGARAEHDRELVAAVPGDQIGRPGRRLQPVRDRDEHLVADQVAVGVVDVLEPVEVDQQQRDRVGPRRSRAIRADSRRVSVSRFARPVRPSVRDAAVLRNMVLLRWFSETITTAMRGQRPRPVERQGGQQRRGDQADPPDPHALAEPLALHPPGGDAATGSAPRRSAASTAPRPRRPAPAPSTASRQGPGGISGSTISATPGRARRTRQPDQPEDHHVERRLPPAPGPPGQRRGQSADQEQQGRGRPVGEHGRQRQRRRPGEGDVRPDVRIDGTSGYRSASSTSAASSRNPGSRTNSAGVGPDICCSTTRYPQIDEDRAQPEQDPEPGRSCPQRRRAVERRTGGRCSGSVQRRRRRAMLGLHDDAALPCVLQCSCQNATDGDRPRRVPTGDIRSAPVTLCNAIRPSMGIVGPAIWIRHHQLSPNALSTRSNRSGSADHAGGRSGPSAGGCGRVVGHGGRRHHRRRGWTGRAGGRRRGRRRRARRSSCWTRRARPASAGRPGGPSAGCSWSTPRSSGISASRIPPSSRWPIGWAPPASTGPRTTGRGSGRRPTSSSPPARSAAWLKEQGICAVPDPAVGRTRRLPGRRARQLGAALPSDLGLRARGAHARSSGGSPSTSGPGGSSSVPAPGHRADPVPAQRSPG